MRRLGPVLVALILLGHGAASSFAAGAAAAPDFPTVDAYVRQAMIDAAAPGISFGVVQNGQVVHLGAFGAAGPDGRQMTVQTPIVIGSVGKSITALAIEQLAEAGRLDIDAPVTRYLPWFTLAGSDTAASQRITVRTLLRHTSGLSTADGQDPRRCAPGLTMTEVARGLSSVSADRAVGTYEYSNLNYVVLGVVVEAVSGQAYGDYLREHVFVPFSIERTFTSPDAAAGSGPATGHRYLFGLRVPFDEPYPSGMVAAGYQISTAEDMANYVAALASRGNVGTDWQPMPAGAAGAASGQSGSTLASNADILLVPSQRLGVVVLINANPTQLENLPRGAADIASDVLRLSQGLRPVAGAPSVLTVYAIVDAALAGLAALLAVHLWRARTWSSRLATARRRRLFIGRTILADGLLPIGVLIGLPLLVGATGSSPAGDVLAGWRFVAWTLPDLAVAVLALAACALALGIVKLLTAAGVRGRRSIRAAGTGQPVAGIPH